MHILEFHLGWSPSRMDWPSPPRVELNDWIIDYFIIHPIQVISLVRVKQIQTVPSGEQMWYEKHLKDIVKLNRNTSSVEVLPC